MLVITFILIKHNLDTIQNYLYKKRLSALSLDSTKRFKSVMTTQRKNISLRPKTFEPQRIPKPKTPLPQLKKVAINLLSLKISTLKLIKMYEIF